MTWNLALRSGGVRGWIFAIGMIVIGGATGCSGGNKSKTLTITSPEADATLTSADDADPDTVGLQYDVLAEATGLSVGTTVELVVGDKVVKTADVATGGNVTFAGVLLPPGVNHIAARTVDLAVSSDEDQQYTYQLLEIVSPAAGDVDDADPGTAGVQVNVVVKAYGILSNVELTVNGDSAGSKAPDSNETVTFAATLRTGDNTLLATTEGDLASEPVVVTAAGGGAGKCSASLVSPAVPAGADSIALGGAACPGDDSAFTTDLAIATGAGDGAMVVLKTEAGATVGAATVDGAVATFTDVPLNEGSNQLVFDIADVGGCETPLGVDIVVDCGGPACSVKSPIPYTYMGDDYINGTHVDGAGRLGIEIETSATGETVQLIVDGGNPIVATAGADGIASFEVLLDDAEHTVLATCGDAGKPQRSTPEGTWTFDTDGCTVDITAPVADYVYVEGEGTQLTATVTGVECLHARVATCDPVAGIDDAVDWDESWDGSGDFDPVFDMVQGPQTQCVEIRDRAGNVGLGSVALQYYPAAPMVAMLTPAADLTMNLDGGGGYTQSPLAGFCQTDFRVECSAIGTPVELFRVGEVDSFATADCATPGAGDTDVQQGFGVATFAAQAFQKTTQDASQAVYATQTFAGTAQDLVGSTLAEAVMIDSDCVRPVYQIAGNACPGGVRSASAGTLTALSFQVLTIDAHRPDSLALELTSQAGNALPGGLSYMATFDAGLGRYVFPNVELGSVADVITMRATTPDAFDNGPTADGMGQILCTVTLSADQPVLPVDPSVAQEAWDPDDNDAACPVAAGGQYEVPVSITIDVADPARRTLEYQVSNGGGTGSLVLGALTDTYCVPVPDDDAVHNIDITLRSADGGSATTAVVNGGALAAHVIASSLLIQSPAGGALTQSSDSGACTVQPALQANQLAVEVISQVDGAHAGDQLVVSQAGNMAAVSVPGGCGASCLVAACLAVDAGNPSTITAQVQGKPADDSVDVVVQPAAPASAITGLTVTLPAANDPLYREGNIGFSWDAPTDLLGSYELRCSRTELTGVDDADAWWAAADTYAISATPPETSGTAQMVIGISHHCMLRGLDYVARPTPTVTTSTPVHYHFRQKVVATGGTSLFGRAVSPAGDLDGDGADDVLIQANGEAFVYYGDNAGTLAAAPQANFFAVSGATNLGRRAASVGDVNDDGEPDVAVTEYLFNGSRGAAYLLFGDGARFPGTTGLEATYDSMTDTYTCAGADVCLVDDTANADQFGWAVAPAGDFDGDGVSDIAVGALNQMVGPDPSMGRVYVLSGAGLCATPGCTVRLPTDDPDGIIIDGVPGVTRNVGFTVATADVDGDTLDDVVITARGLASEALPGQVRYLTGRAFTGGLVAVDWTSLPLVGGAAETGQSYGLSLAFTTNVLDTSEIGVPDLLVSDRSAGRVFVYAGDDDAGTLFSAETRVSITGLSGDVNVGVPVGASQHVVAGAMADLDGDDLAELLVGSLTGGAGEALVIFGADLRDNTVCDGMGQNCTVSAATIAHSLQWVDPANPVPTPVAGYSVCMGGDLTGDSYVDYVIGDRTANTNEGQVTVLY